MGAKVIGVSLNKPTNPSHFDKLKLKNKITDLRFDIRNLENLILF